MKGAVTARLGSMRKAREWSVIPTADDRIIVQAGDAIGIFNWRTGVGKLCTKGGYFPHLAAAKPYQFPAEFVRDCLRACPSLGGESVIGGGVAIVEHTARIIDG